MLWPPTNAVAIAANGSDGDDDVKSFLKRRAFSVSRAFCSPEFGTDARSHSVSNTNSASDFSESEALLASLSLTSNRAFRNAELMSCVVAALAAARVSGCDAATATRSRAESASLSASPFNKKVSLTAHARSAPTAATCVVFLSAFPPPAVPSGKKEAHAQKERTEATHASSSKATSEFVSAVVVVVVVFSSASVSVAAVSFSSGSVTVLAREPFVVPSKKPMATSLCAAPSAGSASAGRPESHAATSALVASSVNFRVT
mmetsp:Transcript_7163/g.29601  ORF Transcript_7163/g.29601 Transcript_7163/m.29601 type:complete len:260 (+) Transcript_7163:4712-5491(+)